MATGGSVLGSNNISNPLCPDCGSQVEILNGDFQFSIDLHKQSHKSLDEISQDITNHLKNALGGSKNSRKRDDYTCPVCKEKVEILNNDVTLSLQLHTQKHKSSNTETSTVDELSSSSGKRKNSDKINKVECKLKYNSVQVGVLDTLFSAMPPGLKSHRGFILDDTSGSACCNICSVMIEPIISVSEHLKTKMHEDNTIIFLKGNLFPDLHQMMDFVSFYGSNLCCNLCRCKIDLCSDNPYKTIVNIMAHNSGKSHLRKKTSSESNVKSDEALVILKSLAGLSTLVNNNIHVIDHKLQPQFKCKLCNKSIAFGQNVDQLLNNFNAHFSAVGHNNRLASYVVKTYEESCIPGRENHSFIVSNGRIYCSLCDCHIEANYKELVCHVEHSVCITSPQNKPTDLVSKSNNISVSSLSTSLNTLPSISINNSVGSENKESKLLSLTKEVVADKVLKDLLNSLPKQYQNISYIVSNENGQVTCLICQCIVPATTYNLKTHLTGSNHKKNERKVKKNVNKNKNGLQKSPVVPQSSQNVLTFDQMFLLLLKTDPLIKINSEMLATHGDGKHYICKICSTLIEASSSLDDFKHNIYLHIKSLEHALKLAMIKEMPEIPTPNNNGVSVIKLFESLSVCFLNDLVFIKALSHEINSVFCSACNLKVPAHNKCLKEHLEGNNHLMAVKRLSATCQETKHGPNADEDDLFKNIMKTDKVLQRCDKILVKRNEHYINCTLCEVAITRSSDKQVFIDNLLSHVTGQKHMKNRGKVVDNMLEKLQLSHPVIRDNKPFIVTQADSVYCTLCACTIPSSVEEENLKKSLLSHLEGSRHIIKKGESNQKAISPSPAVNLSQSLADPVKELFKLLLLHPVIRDNKPFIVKQADSFYCTLCACTIPSSVEEENLKKSLLSHLEGSRHISKKGESNQKAISPSPAVNLSKSLADRVKELFKVLPYNFQKDIVYINKAAVEGYLSCTLCSSIINPHYLRHHLEEEQHVQRRVLNTNPDNQTTTLNATENQNIIKVMGNLDSLLGKIDKKFS